MPDQTLRTVGVIYQIPLPELHPHPQNPFAIRDDPAMRELTESVQKSGVLVPAIVRPREAGGYEIIAGHRRKHACEQSGLDSMPVIILELNDNEAIIQMVDSNIQRENILPSERAKAYKMKMEAIRLLKLQGRCIKTAFPLPANTKRPTATIPTTFPGQTECGKLQRLSALSKMSVISVLTLCEREP